MTADDLTAALRACAAGLYPLEAGAALLTGSGTFLRRDDFTSRFIQHGTSTATAPPDGRHRLGRRDRRPARRRTALLRRGTTSPRCCRPASPAASRSTSATPSPASTTATSRRLVTAILHASGKRPGNSGY